MSAATPSHRASTASASTLRKPLAISPSSGERGIRLTRQRRVILQVMDDAEQHLDVDQILARAKSIDPGVHLVTVYRTIELLKKERLIDETGFAASSRDRHYYETHGPRDHIHVACFEVRESSRV